MTQHSTITHRHLQFEWHKQADLTRIKQADLTRIRGTGKLTTPTFKHASRTHIQAFKPLPSPTLSPTDPVPRGQLWHTRSALGS